MQHKPYTHDHGLIMGSLTAAYIALVCGLKLDGYTTMPWIMLLAPVWFPIFSILFCAVAIVLCAAIFAFIRFLLRK